MLPSTSEIQAELQKDPTLITPEPTNVMRMEPKSKCLENIVHDFSNSNVHR
jgi:hypothetical protein